MSTCDTTSNATNSAIIVPRRERRKLAPHRLVVVLLVAAILLAACGGATATPAAGDPATSAPQLSENGHFLVSYLAEAPPIALNTTHTWLLTVETPDGAPVGGATVTVDGGMPAHQHGLPTQPQVIAGATPGAYRVEGVRFQMPGEWIVSFTIQAGDLTDQVTFPLTLP